MRQHVKNPSAPGLTELRRFALALLFVLLALPQVARVAATVEASPGLRSGHCMATWTNPSTSESWLYVVGGEGSNGYSAFSRTRLPLGVTRRLNDSDWEALDTGNFTVVKNGACIISPDNKYLVVVGGTPVDPHQKPRPWSFASSKDQAGVQVYDILGEKWIPPPVRGGPTGDPNSISPLMDLEGHIAASLPDANWILIFGGNNRRNEADQAQRYFFTLTTQSEDLWIWTPRVPGDTPRAVWQPGVTVVGNKLYILGGTLLNGNSPSKDISVYDTSVSQWTTVTAQLTDGPCSKCQTAIGVSKDQQRLYVIPGVPDTEDRHPIQAVTISALGTVKSVSAVGDRTEPMRDAPLSGDFAYTQFEDVVIIYGGNTIYQYNMTTESWANRISTTSMMVDPSTQSDGSTQSGGSQAADSGYATKMKGPAVWSIVVGAIIGALSIVFLIALILYWRRKKRKERMQYRDGRDTDGSVPSMAKRSRGIALSRSISGGVNDDYSSEKSLPPDGDLADVAFLAKLLRRLSFLDRRYGGSQTSNENSQSEQSETPPAEEDRTHPTNGSRRSSLV